MLEGSLILSRFIHYIATLTLFGVSIFPLYTYTKLRSAPHLLSVMVWLTALAAISALFWFFCVTFSMAGTFDRGAIASVLSETSYGKVWVARIILITIILVFIPLRFKSPSESTTLLIALLCAGLLISLAGVGHTQIDSGTAHIIHVGADAVHLLAAGAWLGGLVSLFSLVTQAAGTSAPNSDAAASNAAMRFSGMGYIAVATLIGSGLINSWFLVGSLENLGTPYGKLLIVKLVLFAGMLGLAGVNRFLIVPKLIIASDAESASELIRLRRHIVGEQALGFLVILIVSVLGMMQPAINPS
jgi:putative copper resistance protein D